MLLLQQTDSVRHAAQAAYGRALDSLSALDLRRAHAAYDSALAVSVEKATMWGTWLGVFVAVLGVAVAVLTIFSAVFLWTQSSDFKRQRRRTLSAVDKRFKEIAATREKEWAGKVAAIDEWRADLERQILTAVPDPKAPRPDINALRAEIDRMRRFVATEAPRLELGYASPYDAESERLAAATGGEFVGFLLHARYMTDDDNYLPQALATIPELINPRIIESANYVVVTGIVPRGQAESVANRLAMAMKRKVSLVQPYPPHVPRA